MWLVPQHSPYSNHKHTWRQFAFFCLSLPESSGRQDQVAMRDCLVLWFAWLPLAPRSVTVVCILSCLPFSPGENQSGWAPDGEQGSCFLTGRGCGLGWVGGGCADNGCLKNVSEVTVDTNAGTFVILVHLTETSCVSSTSCPLSGRHAVEARPGYSCRTKRQS